MAQIERDVSQRIRTVKSSLENAEQNFLDNREIRGELDLMLAEAELKNLRRKQTVPWSWSRNFLAACVAILLTIAGFGGWYLAKGREAAPVAPVVLQEKIPVQSETKESDKKISEIITPTEEKFSREISAEEGKTAKEQVGISKKDLHKLVQSARVELSNSQ